MISNIPVFGGNGLGQKTATAGTEILHLVPPLKNAYTRMTRLAYRAGATAHNLTAMRPLGTTTLAANAAASQAVIVLSAQPQAGNNVAAADYLAWEAPDGTVRFGKVSSATGLSITMTANLAVAVVAGAKVWFFGAITDLVPQTGEAHPIFSGVASVTTVYSDTSAGILATFGKYEPILVHSGNATNAGFLEGISYVYTTK